MKDENALTTVGGGATNYLNEYQVGPSGTILKWTKGGEFARSLDGTVVPEGTELVCVYPQTQAGYIKFNGEGNPPDRHMGPIFAGFMPPKRAELGDHDESLWEEGLNGKPQDPWQHQIMLPLVATDGSDEKFIFVTSSLTGRNAVNKLLDHCNKMAKREPDHFPVVQLKIGGFQHRDDRIGWIKTPAFAIVGKAPRDDVSLGKEALKDDMSDDIPF